MINKKIALAFVFMCILFCITGCGSGASSVESGVPQATDGSYSGGKDADNINLKSVDVKTEGESTLVTLSFISGSRNSGSGTESSIDYVPAYKAYMLADHSRFVVEIPGLQWWDFERDTQYSTDSLANTALKGMFGLVTYNDRPYQLYLQLSASSNVTVTQKSNTITIKFSPKQTDSKEKYYLIANSYYEYKDGNIAQSYGLTPTLCSDSQHKVLISGPFDSESDAKKLKTKLLSELGVIIEDADLAVVKLKADTLPTFNFTKDEMAIYDVAVFAKIGSTQKQKAEITLPGGYYLTASSDGTQIVYKKRVAVEDSTDDSSQLEELWIINNTTNTKEKIGDEYNAIYSAKYSSDGKKIAYLDISVDADYSASELYVYNFETKELRNLSEEGLGNVSTYDWGSDSNTLYTVSQLGVANSAQVLKCDLSKSSDNMATSVKDQKVTPNYDGGLTYANNKLYLRDYDAATDNFIIYEIDPNSTSADWVKIANGVIFDVSADGKYMLVESYIANADPSSTASSTDTSGSDQESDNYSDDEVPNADVTVITLSNKEKKKIISNQQVYKAGFVDNDTAFYILKQSGSDAAFPYMLKNINVDGNSSKDICQIAGFYVQPTGIEDTYYLMDSKDVSESNDLIDYVTYTIKKSDLSN